MELYKYTGSVAALTVRFGNGPRPSPSTTATTTASLRFVLMYAVLWPSTSRKIEGTVSEERYMNLDWY